MNRFEFMVKVLMGLRAGTEESCQLVEFELLRGYKITPKKKNELDLT